MSKFRTFFRSAPMRVNFGTSVAQLIRCSGHVPSPPGMKTGSDTYAWLTEASLTYARR